ncbi:glutathione-disulfide reductase [Marinimicrobium sp. C2-29]|uniref:glutathione-disulfide reductase n=1 Tax=Marinimicrobium sp. C2-29 TaxID=3139825 RepID=UPI003138E30D
MADYDYDLLVIGAGSGGVRASRIAAQLGAKVAVVEERYLGGTCVNVGCVPKKLFVYASHYREAFHAALGHGWHAGSIKFDWSELRRNKDREIERLNGIYERMLNKAGVEIIDGSARLLGPHRVSVGEREISAERILIAVGGWPWVPDIPGREHVITSNEAFYLDELPQRMVIVGGGYIAVEFAGIFNGLGVETHLCYRGDLFLRGFDQDLRDHLASEMPKKGVHLHFNTDISAVEQTGAGDYRVTPKEGAPWNTDLVMYATGRKPKTEGLGLENTAVDIADDGHLSVNGHFQTAEPSIYALGDVTGPMELTPVALAQGMAMARNLFSGDDRPISYRDIPTAVFSQPPMATVGLTEREAREEYTEIDVYRSAFRPMQYSLTDLDERALVKLLVDRATDRVVGCHMVGPEAAEIMQGLGVALTAGATKADFDRTIGIHPTLAEEFVTLRQPVTIE